MSSPLYFIIAIMVMLLWVEAVHEISKDRKGGLLRKHSINKCL